MYRYQLSKIVFVFLFVVLMPFHFQATNISYTPEEITHIENAGTYPVEINYKDEETGEFVKGIIYVTIHHKRTVENKKIWEAIDAHDITIAQEKFMKISDQELIHLTNAHAWNMQDGSSIPIAEVTRETADKATGVYAVQFATANGTATTVNVREAATRQMISAEQYYSFSEFPQIFYFPLVFGVLFLLMLLLLVSAYQQMKNKLNETKKLLYDREKNTIEK